MLYNIRFKGIQGYCAGLITDDNFNIWFLSVTGYQTMVKGIISNILKGESVAVTIKGSNQYFKRTDNIPYMTYSQKLYSGLLTIALLPKIAIAKDYDNKEEFMIMVNDNVIGAAKIEFFEHLDEKIEIPLHRSWTDWLWQMFIQKEWMTELKTCIGNNQGFLIHFDADELEKSIAESIAMQLPQLMTCFEKGEHHADHRTEGVS